MQNTVDFSTYSFSLGYHLYDYSRLCLIKEIWYLPVFVVLLPDIFLYLALNGINISGLELGMKEPLHWLIGEC